MNRELIKNASYLYVEDVASNRSVMQVLIEKVIGARSLTIFEDSANFMEQVRSLPSRPDLFILDIHVQPYDGFEMLNMLRADPDYRHVKVIAITASVMNEEIERLRSSGFNGAIGKPVNMSAFPGLIARVLEGESVWSIA